MDADLRSAHTLAIDMLMLLVRDEQLMARPADAYLDSLSKIRTVADFPDAVVDIMASFDDALGMRVRT